MNKRFKYALLLGSLAFAGLWAGWQMEKESAVLAYNKNNLIRFHVIANSNTAQDQALKYQVRDVIIKSMGQRFESVGDVDKAREITRESLDDIKNLAASYVRDAGYDYPVQVSLGQYPFPAKSYNLGSREGKTDFLTLPADTYEAVRVVIGEGKGDNWWCILFPPLCFVDFTKVQTPQAIPRSLPVTSMAESQEMQKMPDSSEKNAAYKDFHEDISEKISNGNVQSEAVQAFKLQGFHKVDEEKRYDRIEHDEGSNDEESNIELRFRCVEVYNHTISWFSKVLNTHNT